MSEAKIRLSQKEMEVVTNTDLILTKNAIIEKAKELLRVVQDKQETWLKTEKKIFFQALESSPKISKGENYNGLPYLILDFPRLFEQENIFAVRTMFWWGNFFSITLHVKGTYKKMFEEKLVQAHDLLADEGFYFCINGHQWAHDFETKNYILLAALTKNDFEKNCRDKEFIKLAKKISLAEWHNAPDKLFNYFKQMIEILGA